MNQDSNTSGGWVLGGWLHNRFFGTSWPSCMGVNYHEHFEGGDHNEYSGGSEVGYTITDNGGYTEDGQTGVSEATTSFSQSWTYDDLGDNAALCQPSNVTSDSGNSFSQHAQADFSETRDWAQQYNPTSVLAMTQSSDKGRNLDTLYHNESSGTYTDPMRSMTSNTANDHSTTAHDAWHYASASNSGGWSYASSDDHTTDNSSSYSSAYTDGTNSQSANSGYDYPSSSSATYGTSQGTPPGTLTATSSGPSGAAYAALADALVADAATAYTATTPAARAADVDAAIASFEGLDNGGTFAALSAAPTGGTASGTGDGVFGLCGEIRHGTGGRVFQAITGQGGSGCTPKTK